MAVDTTWTDPSTGGAIDLGTGGILTETIYDKILSNLKRLGGTDGDSKTGLLNLSATGQIQFPASQNASADANTLDDYEEGTWTPNVGGSATYTAQAGYYCKIGQLIWIVGDMTINAIGSGSTTTISGLPVTSLTGPVQTPVAFSWWESLSVTAVYVTGYVGSGASTVIINGAAAATATLTPTYSVLQNGSRIVFAGCYRAAS